MAVNREFLGETPSGMTFSSLAGNVGGGLQTPGFMGCGKVFLTSKKFLFAEGGLRRMVWMPKELKALLKEDLDKRFEEQGITGFMDSIADETVATDPNEIKAFMEKTGHPALEMKDMTEYAVPDETVEQAETAEAATTAPVEIKEKIEEIKNNNFNNVPTLSENIEKGNQLLRSVEKSKNDNQQVILNIESELKSFNIEGIENDIEIEEKLRNNFELRNKKISQKDNLLLSIENFKFKIKEFQSEIEKYQEYKIKIEENKTIQFSIDRIDEKILIVKENIKDLEQENIDTEKDIILMESEINLITTKIKKYLKQKKKDELLKEYQKCVSRDGLPTFLLKKSIHIINKELNEILTNVNFTLFFDENLILKMSADDRLDVNQNIIEGSGMERTFCALALKIALRQINVKSKSTFICLDEVMGKMINNSVQLFMELLDDLKTKVKKIIIIEHNHQINYDQIISVQKDSNLISSLSIVS